MKAAHRQDLMERELISPLLQWRYNGRDCRHRHRPKRSRCRSAPIGPTKPSSTALGGRRRSRR
jgi:hypothetical protein